MRSTNASDGTLSLRVSFEVGCRPRHGERAGAEPPVRGGGRPAGGGQAVRRDGQEGARLPADARRLYSPNGTFDNNFLSNYANINIVDAHVAHPRRRAGQPVRRQRLRDADVDPARPTRPVERSRCRMSDQRDQGSRAWSSPGGQPRRSSGTGEGTEFTYTVRTKGRLATPGGIRGNVVRPLERRMAPRSGSSDVARRRTRDPALRLGRVASTARRPRSSSIYQLPERQRARGRG